MRILVTGADGFIGSALSRELAKTHEVIRLVGKKRSRSPAEIEFDLTKKIPVVENVDVCFHLAALTDVQKCDENENLAFEINATGTQNVAEMLRQHSKKPLLAYASTAGVCGENVIKPINEKTPYDSKANNYNRSKAQGERNCGKFSSFFPVVIARLYFPYGRESKNPNRFISRIATAIAKGTPIQLNNGGRPVTNPIHVSDVVRFAQMLIKKKTSISGYRNYQVCGPEVGSIKELAEKIGRKLKKRPNFVKTGRESGNYIGDGSLALKEIGFKPKVPLGQGIDEVLKGLSKTGRKAGRKRGR
ncbi:TPA: NAD(P)-dependent oxidoreductase [Candidatus Micrarchaeota archaeon]|nr:NAD(P)-dependent oxidoreductase [Candidatus Micrarchaeota archaeon]